MKKKLLFAFKIIGVTIVLFLFGTWNPFEMDVGGPLFTGFVTIIKIALVLFAAFVIGFCILSLLKLRRR